MARVNIDDWIDADDRFRLLTRLVGGDDDKARGMLVRFWRMAQRFWGDDMKLVPVDDFEAHGFTPILQAKLAEKRDGGIYAISKDPGEGSAELFAWYLQICQAAKASAESRKQRKADSVPTEGDTRSNGESDPNQPPSPTPSPTQILKDKTKGVAVAPPISGLPAVVGKKPRSGNPEAEQAFIKTYVDAYKARYGPTVRPECLNDGKSIGQVRNFLVNRPLERAQDLIQVYLQMDDPWFLKFGHDLITFMQKINQIGLALHNGRDPTKPKTFLEYMQEREAMNGPKTIQRTN